MSGEHSQSRLRLRPSTRGHLTVRNLRLALLPVAGGLALAFHILAGTSLPLAFGVLVFVGVAAWLIFHQRADPPARADVARRLRMGFVAGLVATLAYDTVRYTVVAAAGFSVDPFRAWSLFGAALLGPESSPLAHLLVGTAYHLFNGVGFAVAFTLLVRRPTVLLGVLWGLALEFAMVWLYPAWMRITQLEEFLTMSVLGHITYGVALALLARRLITRDATASDPRQQVLPQAPQQRSPGHDGVCE
jgi:hypothetical protein